jgi:short-subunit dehydrogenase
MKKAIITGGSYGIGEGLAKKFAENGIEVILIARTESKLKEVKEEIERKGGKAHIYKADLITENLKSLFDRIVSEHQDVDVLVNNAGFGTIGAFYKLDTEKEVDMVELNVRVLLELSSYFLKYRIEKGGGGVLVNISSLAGFFPIPYFATYAATKAFVLSFSEAIRREVEDFGIRVITICPGGIKTEFQKRAGVPEDVYSLQDYLTVEEAVEYMWKAIVKNKSPYVPGNIMNKLYSVAIRIIPIPLLTLIAKNVMRTRFKEK